MRESRTMPARPQRASRARPESPDASGRRPRVVPRSAQLPLGSRLLYRIDHYSSLPGVAVAVVVAVLGGVAAGAAFGFTTTWSTAFSVAASAVTLIMVFSIQHTQAREQAATQRKLDELLRALPGTEESLIMLEEAPQEVLLEVEEQQRDHRSTIGETPPASPGRTIS